MSPKHKHPADHLKQTLETLHLRTRYSGFIFPICQLLKLLPASQLLVSYYASSSPSKAIRFITQSIELKPRCCTTHPGMQTSVFLSKYLSTSIYRTNLPVQNPDISRPSAIKRSCTRAQTRKQVHLYAGTNASTRTKTCVQTSAQKHSP